MYETSYLMSMISTLTYEFQTQNSNNALFARACASKHCLQLKSVSVCGERLL